MWTFLIPAGLMARVRIRKILSPLNSQYCGSSNSPIAAATCWATNCAWLSASFRPRAPVLSKTMPKAPMMKTAETRMTSVPMVLSNGLDIPVPSDPLQGSSLAERDIAAPRHDSPAFRGQSEGDEPPQILGEGLRVGEA